MRGPNPPSSSKSSRRLARAYFSQLRDLGELEVYCSALPLDGARIRVSAASSATLESIAARIEHCQACRLHRTRTRVVPGGGNPSSGLVMIGEAPGQREDQQGLPFVGPSGMLLRRLCAFAGMPDSKYYLVNVLKCRPPANRDPLPDEVAACAPFLEEQLAVLTPRIIVCLGRFAGRWVLGSADLSMRAMRGSIHRRGDARVIVTYHPSALLHKSGLRADAWRDLTRIGRLAREYLALPREVA